MRSEIVLLDARTDWRNDRTWCFWDTGDVPYAELATASWGAWRVVEEDGREHVQRGPRYLHLPAERYYEALVPRLQRAPNVRFELGTVVRERPRGAGRVYDALGSAPGLPVDALRQRFLGQVVRTTAPVFDPEVVTLMDFRVGQRDGVHFVYVLPFSPTLALVEDTHLGLVKTPADVRRRTVRRYLRQVHGVREFAVEHEERGSIPMAGDLRGSPWSVGTAAAAVRPSSGYAFVRTQRHVRAVARAAADHERRHGPATARRAGPTPPRAEPPPAPGSPRTEALDRLFLAALRRRPDAFPALFAQLAERVDGAPFARFMNDASSRADELRMAAAVPRLPLLASSPTRS